jgi:preprotein translocase subunit SecD
MLLTALLVIATPQQGCPKLPEDWSIDDPKPLQQTGKGLWIGGIGFLSTDIAGVEVKRDPYDVDWVIEVKFSAAGNTKFVAAQRCGIGQIVEVSLDRKVISRPALWESITGGAALISGGWRDRAEAEAIAKRLSPR